MGLISSEEMDKWLYETSALCLAKSEAKTGKEKNRIEKEATKLYAQMNKHIEHQKCIACKLTRRRVILENKEKKLAFATTETEKLEIKACAEKELVEDGWH